MGSASSVRQSSWLDAKASTVPQGRNVPGVFVSLDPNAAGHVLVSIGDEYNVVSVPANGSFYEGQDVMVCLAGGGDPLSLLEGSDWDWESVGVDSIASVGTTAQRIKADRVEFEQRDEERRVEAERIRGEFEAFVPAVNEDIVRFEQRATDLTAELEAEKSRVTTALEKAFEAEGGVQGALTAVSTLDQDLRPKITAAQTAANQAASDLLVERGRVDAQVEAINGLGVDLDAVRATANTAKSDAAAAAGEAATAKTNAGNAQTAADQAKADATSKSAAAEAAAKTYAQAQATAAESAAKAAASSDATAKANAARDAAIAAAALDAKTKADAAEAAAKAKAQTAQTLAEQAVNKADAAQERADLAKGLADAAQTLANTADGKAAAAQASATAAGSAAANAQSRADSAFSNAATAQSAASAAQTKASKAETDAATAATAAANAAGIANGKAVVLFQDAAPVAQYRNALTLWVDTTGGANTPKRWSTGTTWVAVTDKAATDAANAAAAAQTTANTAKTNAATAQSKADQAFTNAATAKTAADQAAAAALLAQSKADVADAKATTADGRLTVASANPTTADATGKPIGAVWEVRSGSILLRRYVLTAATTWTQVKAGQDFIGDKAIGTAQIGDAAVGTLQVANASITDAKMGNISAGKVDASLGSFTVATIGSLVGDAAFLKSMYANRIVVASDNLVADPRFEQTLGIAWTGTTSSYPSFSVSDDATLGPSIRCNAAVGSGWRQLKSVNTPAKEGDQFVASCRARTSGTNWGGTYAPSFGVWFYDSTGNIIATPGLKFSVTANGVNNADYSFEATAPAGTAYARYALSIPSGATAGVAVLAMPTLKRKVGTVLIEDGAVTAPKITASQELSAKVAEFLKLKTSSLVWDTAAGNSAWITSLVGDSAFFDSMLTSRLLVSSGNLLKDTSFKKEWWPGSSAYTLVATGGYSGGPAASFAPSSAQQVIRVAGAQTATNRELMSECVGGTKVRASVWVKSTTEIPANGVAVYIDRFGTSNSASSTGKNWPTAIPANTWTEISAECTLRDSDTFFSGYFISRAADSTGTTVFSDPRVIQMTGSILLENGAVSAEKLAAKIALVSRLIAGPENGTHAELDQTGFHAYRPLITGGVAEVVSLGVDGSTDYLAITDGSGDTLSSLDDVGGGSFRSVVADRVEASTDLVVAGEVLAEFVPRYAARIIASETFDPGTWNVTWSGARFIFDNPSWKRAWLVTWKNDSGADHTVWIPPIVAPVRTDRSSLVGSRWVWTLDGSTVPLSGGTGRHTYETPVGAGYVTVHTPQMTIVVPAGATLKLAWDMYNGGFEWIFNSAFEVSVWDLGPVGNYADATISPQTLTRTDGGSNTSAPSAKKTYVTTWSGTWMQSYVGDGSKANSTYTGKAVQGTWSPNTFRGLVGFPSMVSTLSGAEIVKVEAYVYMDHWYYNSGGSVGVAMHDKASAPATLSTGLSGVQVYATTAKPGGAWVTLPAALYAQIKTGGWKGFGFIGSGLAAYGYANTPSKQKIRVTYKK